MHSSNTSTPLNIPGSSNGNGTPAPSNAFAFAQASFADILDDISTRFILNLPDEELRSIERVCFQVEQAHWFYEDFIREANPKLPSLPLKKFSAELFNACPMLQHWSADHEQAFNQFMQYKIRVPVCGAIMLNDNLDKCVLVKGYKASSGWGFPKGKINQNEREVDCAVREVLEETGYNLADQIKEDDYYNCIVREQSITLFIVRGVSEDFEFKTRTRKEIGKIEWFKLSDLPTWKRKRDTPGKFYLIVPFISHLKDWIARQKRSTSTKPILPPSTHLQLPPPPLPIANGNGNLRNGSSEDESSQSPIKESSSLSSGTGEVGPKTPSPERAVFLAQEAKGLDLGVVMDPHLANLLSGLSLSDPAKTAAVPIPVPVVEVNVNVSKKIVQRKKERKVTPTTAASSDSGSVSVSVQAPLEAESTSSTIVPDPPTAPILIPIPTPPTNDTPNTKFRFPTKRAKHIALLDSVMEDLTSPPLPPSLPPTSPQSDTRQPQQQYLPRYPYMNGTGYPQPQPPRATSAQSLGGMPYYPHPQQQQHMYPTPLAGSVPVPHPRQFSLPSQGTPGMGMVQRPATVTSHSQAPSHGLGFPYLLPHHTHAKTHSQTAHQSQLLALLSPQSHPAQIQTLHPPPPKILPQLALRHGHGGSPTMNMDVSPLNISHDFSGASGSLGTAGGKALMKMASPSPLGRSSEHGHGLGHGVSLLSILNGTAGPKA